jgi:hypothetical protein
MTVDKLRKGFLVARKDTFDYFLVRFGQF